MVLLHLPTLVLWLFTGLDNHMRKIFPIIFIISFGLLPASAFAAAIRIAPSPLKVEVSVPFDIEVDINSQNESVNAIDGHVILPAGIMVDSINDAQSIISLWIEHPHQTENHTVSFSGVIPG